MEKDKNMEETLATVLQKVADLSDKLAKNQGKTNRSPAHRSSTYREPDRDPNLSSNRKDHRRSEVSI